MVSNINSEIRSLIESSPLNQTDVGRSVGMSAQSMNNLLARNDAKVSTVIDVLETLGYQLVIVPKGKRLPDSSVVVRKVVDSAE